jgi:Pyrimidine dimer DNA glycosylase
MNLFILSLSTKKCAEYMFDKHIYKILLEAVQMLCTAKRILDPTDPICITNKIYKTAHINHPVSKWVRESRENFKWTLRLVKAMHREWKYRYNHPEDKQHKSYLIYRILKKNIPSREKFSLKGRTPFALAMPNKYKVECPVKSYRQYYMGEEKQHLTSWKGRNKPKWFRIKSEKTT